VAIDIKVQDQVHGVLEIFGDDPSETLAQVCARAPRGSLLRGVHPYGDTMFNMVQLEFLIDEIDGTTAKHPAEQEILSRLRIAADTAIRKRGYLYFVGD
jgi:hypothetical protein